MLKNKLPDYVQQQMCSRTKFCVQVQIVQEAPRVLLADLLLNNLTIYIAMSVFIILLCFTLAAEYRSRQKAITLTSFLSPGTEILSCLKKQ